MTESILGIDIAKKKFDVVLLAKGKEKHKIFSNNYLGFEKFVEWLTLQEIPQAHACMEATGFYGDALALFLYNLGYKVSVVNPSRIKAYGRSELSRNKTDKADSALIARFCKCHQPGLWIPPSPELQQLRHLYRCLKALKDEKQQIVNRLEQFAGEITPVSHTWSAIAAYFSEHINIIQEEIKALLQKTPELLAQHELLKTIPGIKDTTATALLAELPDIKRFSNAREVAAFAGLTPAQRQSGTSLRGRSYLSKIGSSSLRKALYMPAIVAKQYNPALQRFCSRLKAKDKHNMVIVGAVMRKMLHIVYGVLKSQRPFEEKLHA